MDLNDPNGGRFKKNKSLARNDQMPSFVALDRDSGNTTSAQNLQLSKGASLRSMAISGRETTLLGKMENMTKS